MAGFAYTLDQIRRLADVYCAATGTSPTALGRAACGNTMVIQRIMDGKGCHARNAEQVTRFFDEQWPKNLRWPKGLPRNLPQAPLTSRRAAPAAAPAARPVARSA